MLKTRQWIIVSIALLFGGSGLLANTIIISTGDNLVHVTWSHYDSEESIKANFEAMQRDWGLERIWWRGGEQKYIYEYTDIVSDDSVMHADIWRWFFEHNENVSRAVDIGKEMGLEMWLWKGLFEFGASEDTGGNGRLPFTFEHHLRKEHPEWLPVNKFGTRRQAGPIAFCYPDARAAYIQTLKDFLLQEGYDGIAFSTYVENFGTRYLDEFGFNQPIVDEFKRRYGVDIRTEPFDKEAWADLRGEYVTQFLRELRAALRPHHIKIAVMLSSEDIDGQGPRPDLPSVWPGIWSTLDKQRIGRLRMDWQTWADEGLVDELNIYYPGCVTVAGEVGGYCQQHNPAVRVSIYLMGGSPDVIPEGVDRICYFPGGTPIAMQSGFSAEQVDNPPIEFIDPARILKDGDKWQKRQVLYLAATGRLKLDLKDMAAASEDDDIFVRNMAIRALRASGLAAAVPLIEAKLNDVENSVRILAAVELGNLPGANSLQKIFDTILSYGNCQYNFFAIPQSLQAMKANDAIGQAQKLLLSRYCAHADTDVRQAAIYAIASLGLIGEFKNEILTVAAEDTDNFCRTLAMYYAANFSIDETYPILEKNIKSQNHIVQVRAAEAFGMYTETRLTEAYRERILLLLLDVFEAYGSGNNRTDRKWGWRIVGESLLGLGATGESALETLMHKTTDPTLADLAWRVLYIPQYRNKYAIVTEEEDEIAHRFRPIVTQ